MKIYLKLLNGDINFVEISQESITREEFEKLLINQINLEYQVNLKKLILHINIGQSGSTFFDKLNFYDSPISPILVMTNPKLEAKKLR